MLSKILYSKLTQINLQTNMESIKEGASSSLNTSFGFFSQIKPYAVQILLGASVGFIAGYTFRKVARSLAILIIAMAAILFILINYTDLINIDLLTIKSIGVAAKDMALQHRGIVFYRIKDFALTNIPFISGFLLGFYGGLRVASKK